MSKHFLHTSVLYQNASGTYRFVRPADVARKIHDKRMVCDMGEYLDCVVQHHEVQEMTQAMAQAWKIEDFHDENTFLSCVYMCYQPCEIEITRSDDGL